MAYLVGVDEAGYGPNLGPLIIVATVWKTPAAMLADQQALPDAVSEVVCGNAVSAARTDRLAIADSKTLYSPQRGLAPLERNVLAALHALDRRPSNWREVWHAVSADSDIQSQLDEAPWRREYQAPAPCEADPVEIERVAIRFREGLSEVGVSLEEVRAIAVFPKRFNELVERHGNKGSALSHCSLELIESILHPLEAEVLVHCDKHGGRNKYAPLLQHHFDVPLLQVRREGAAESSYGWGPKERRTNIRFVAKGDAFLPASLSSMFAKYLRELAMRAFNAYWQAELPGLKPTAGYPVDALRFHAEIRDAQARLGIDDQLLWRSR